MQNGPASPLFHLSSPDCDSWLAIFISSMRTRQKSQPLAHHITPLLLRRTSVTSSSTKTLSVLFDNDLRINEHVNSNVRLRFFQLRSIENAILIGDANAFPISLALERFIHTLVLSRLDYCNYLYSDISQAAISHHQVPQKAAE